MGSSGVYIRSIEHRRAMSEIQKTIASQPEKLEKNRLAGLRMHELYPDIFPPVISGDNHWTRNRPRELLPMFKGYKYCIDCGKQLARRAATRCVSCSKSKEHHPRWKGGTSKLRNKICNSFEYRQWRSDVFTRDNFTCQECGNTKSLEAHHIKRFSLIIKQYQIKNLNDALNCSELWNINNGKTLCKVCHKKTYRAGS